MVFALAGGSVGCASAPSATAHPTADVAEESTETEPPLTEQQLSKVVKLCSDATPTMDSAAACMLLGAMSSEGLAGTRDAAHADAMFQRAVWIQLAACERDDLEACYMLGSLRAIKLSTLEPDSAQATEWAEATLPLLERACRGGHGHACELVGTIHENGRGVARDLMTAAQAYGRACEHGRAQSCRWGSDDEQADTAGPAVAGLTFGPF